MTTFALGSRHIWTMRFMTLGTLRDSTMCVVAESAGQFGMFALNLLQFDDLWGVAGQTLFGDVVCQPDDLGGMWIVVAT